MLIFGSIGNENRIMINPDAEKYNDLINLIYENCSKSNYEDLIIGRPFLDKLYSQFETIMKGLLEGYSNEKSRIFQGVEYLILGAKYRLNTKEDALHRRILMVNSLLNSVLYARNNEKKLLVLNILEVTDKMHNILYKIGIEGIRNREEFLKANLGKELERLIEKGYLSEVQNGEIILSEKAKFYLQK